MILIIIMLMLIKMKAFLTQTMDRLINLLHKPGQKGEIQGVAPTQRLPEETKDKPSTANITTRAERRNRRILDRWLDQVVRVSGSEAVFFTIVAGLLVWAFLGIRYGKSSSWEVIISDVQAIVSYLFDSLLVRQQLNSYEDEMAVAAELQSRILSHARMLRKVHQTVVEKGQCLIAAPDGQMLEFEAELPPETWFGRCTTVLSHVFGHLTTVALFWASVFVWIGLGPRYGWSDRWQLYMNSASSALMVFVFAFLANIRERHSAYTRKCLDGIFTVDSALELRLRALTGDILSNDIFIIPAPKVNRIQRIIFYYADFVGTLIGIAILLLVIVIWICIGPLLHFSSSWWLLIGTYAGLVGMNDGFVLRNMQARLRSYVDVEFDKIHEEDTALFAAAGLPAPEQEPEKKFTITQRVSETMNWICAHELAVIAGFLTIIGLIMGASAMRWTITGQLLCNVPPSLIESFFMIILITGHNSAECRNRLNLRYIYERRLKLLEFVDCVTCHRDELGVQQNTVVEIEVESGSLAIH